MEKIREINYQKWGVLIPTRSTESATKPIAMFDSEFQRGTKHILSNFALIITINIVKTHNFS